MLVIILIVLANMVGVGQVIQDHLHLPTWVVISYGVLAGPIAFTVGEWLWRRVFWLDLRRRHRKWEREMARLNALRGED